MLIGVANGKRWMTMTDLIKAMAEVNDLNRSHGVTQRGGKKYTEVFVRVEAFRKAFGTKLGITTERLEDDGNKVVVQARVINESGMIVGSGLAEEIRGSSNVNRTSPLENAETSAIGRALASLGLHGGSYASSFEIDVAQHNDKALKEKPAPKPQQKETLPDQQKAIEWCKALIAKYDAAPTLKALHDIDRNTPDEHLNALKQDYPKLHARLIQRFTEKENSYE